MAKTAMKIKQQRKAKFSTREYTRCRICGRPHAYLRKYGICRICFRELAYKGQIPGVKKASWQAESNLMNASHQAQHEFSARSFPNLNETECKRRLSLVEGSGANLLKLKLLY